MSLNIKFTIDDSKFLTTEYLRQRQCPGMTEEGTRKYLGFFPQCKAILTISRDEKGNITFKTTDFDDNENDKISQTKFLKICRNECEKYFNYYQGEVYLFATNYNLQLSYKNFICHIKSILIINPPRRCANGSIPINSITHPR